MAALSMQHKSWGPMDDPSLLNTEEEEQEEEDDHSEEVADALLGFFTDPSDASHLSFDSLFDSPTPPPPPPLPDPSFGTNILLSATHHHPSFSAPSSMLSTPPDPYAPSSDDDLRLLYHCWKRPRSCSDLHRPPSSSSEDFSLPAPAARATGGRCLSAQSVAARARRRRISEKTQELGRLIPGGSRMSTAEMFQAAFKYVKFLQAQVGILGLMGSLNKDDRNGAEEVEQRLGGLLGSMQVQEKLTGEGRCIVPEKAVNAMSEDDEVKSNPSIARELDRFIQQLHRSPGEDW